MLSNVFFFNDTATTEIYTLSLHDALPISTRIGPGGGRIAGDRPARTLGEQVVGASGSRPPCLKDRKSTRLNSSHANISYAVFCLKKKKLNNITSFFLVPAFLSILSLLPPL